MSSKQILKSLAAALFLALPLATPSLGDSLSVSPTRLTVPAPGKATTITIKAEGKGAAVVQIRVMAWQKGTDPNKMKATKAVVVSPPAAKLGARQELTLRIVRTSKKPVKGSECYRVLIDQLPAKSTEKQTIKLQVRQSVPLCFES